MAYHHPVRIQFSLPLPNEPQPQLEFSNLLEHLRVVQVLLMSSQKIAIVLKNKIKIYLIQAKQEQLTILIDEKQYEGIHKAVYCSKKQVFYVLTLGDRALLMVSATKAIPHTILYRFQENPAKYTWEILPSIILFESGNLLLSRKFYSDTLLISFPRSLNLYLEEECLSKLDQDCRVVNYRQIAKQIIKIQIINILNGKRRNYEVREMVQPGIVTHVQLIENEVILDRQTRFLISINLKQGGYKLLIVEIDAISKQTHTVRALLSENSILKLIHIPLYPSSLITLELCVGQPKLCLRDIDDQIQLQEDISLKEGLTISTSMKSFVIYENEYNAQFEQSQLKIEIIKFVNKQSLLLQILQNTQKDQSDAFKQTILSMMMA